jgi:hypothetical protein
MLCFPSAKTFQGNGDEAGRGSLILLRGAASGTGADEYK